eukprot:10882448-Karenia_brevis.AAC.1
MAGMEPMACFDRITSATKSLHAPMAKASHLAIGLRRCKKAKLSRSRRKRYRYSKTSMISAPGRS